MRGFPNGGSFLLATLAAACVAAADDADKPAAPANSVAVEALLRLEGVDLNANPGLKKAAIRVLETTRGTAAFVQIVKKFEMTDQDAGLLEVAEKNPGDETGVEAIRLILAHDDTALIKAELEGTNNAAAGATLEALGNAREKRTVPLMLPVLVDAKRDSGVRKKSVRALAQTQEGCEELLRLAKADKLGQDVRFIASSELNAARWPAIKAEAAKITPLPQGKNQASLPPVRELLMMRGDAANGAKVLARPETGCLSCHRIKGEGAQIGPDLSEIGTKLGKDAIYEAILDPSAGIAFGYEAYQVALKSGDEAYGLIVSDTADELAMKDLKGIVTRYKKSDIATKEQLKTSIMPTGLQQSMTTQEFADLVEYLSTLRKPGN
jgi:putative heme-binding domain-containing protein